MCSLHEKILSLSTSSVVLAFQRLSGQHGFILILFSFFSLLAAAGRRKSVLIHRGAAGNSTRNGEMVFGCFYNLSDLFVTDFSLHRLIITRSEHTGKCPLKNFPEWKNILFFEFYSKPIDVSHLKCFNLGHFTSRSFSCTPTRNMKQIFADFSGNFN